MKIWCRKTEIKKNEMHFIVPKLRFIIIKLKHFILATCQDNISHFHLVLCHKITETEIKMNIF